MKIIGYSWAKTLATDEEAETDDSTKVIRQYMKRRRLEGPVQLEDPSQAFEYFGLRPCGSGILEMLRPGDVIVVADHGYLFSTASQGISTLRLLKNRHISVYSVDLGADIINGKLFDIILSILSPLEKIEPKLAGERVRARKQLERQRGRYLGGNPPLGYIVTSDGRIEADGTKKRLIRKILRLKASGMSLRKIASELQSGGVKISHTGVDKLLKSTGYVGPKTRRLELKDAD